MRNRVKVMHGVNLDQLGRRDPAHYGDMTYAQLETRISEFGRELGLQARSFQTNHEGAFVEELHKAEDVADAIIINAGAWSHYSYAIRDALELAGLPAVEVHLSDIYARERWRQTTVLSELCLTTIVGKGAEGYRDALERVKQELAGE
jgi:3-dehydroquinate dehydratase-2